LSRRSPGVRVSFALALVALLLVPAAALAAPHPQPAAPRPQSDASAAVTCTKTVSGFTATAVHQARDAAGVNGVVCFPAGTYTGDLLASVAGQQWRLDDNATLTGITKITGTGVMLYNGRVTRPAVDRWIASVEIRADNVTVQSIVFRGGGTGVGVYGKDHDRIVNNGFANLTGSAVSVWSEGVGADYTVIKGNRITQSKTVQVSPITSRGNESGNHGGVQNYRLNIRGNTIDQGAGDIGWFGIELKQSKGAIVENNTITGGQVLVSLPETDGAYVRYNTFDLRGSAHWGIEDGNAWDTKVVGNTFIGDGKTGVDYGVSMNTNPLRTIVDANTATNMRTLVGIAGDYHQITNNCLTNVANVVEFMLNGGPHIVVSGNGPC